MNIKEIILQNFRNYTKKQIEFTAQTTFIVGSNAVGKTNILEAIYLLATGRSIKAGVETEMIRYGEQVGRVMGTIKNGGEINKLEIVLTTGDFNGQRIAKKKYLVNGVARRMSDLVGIIKAVYFGPEDMEIIIGSPSIRRDYLDKILDQADREYRRANLSYRKGLRQRNKLLEQIREEGKPRSALFFWDQLLIENGSYMTRLRQEYLDFINNQSDKWGGIRLVYDKSYISEERLAQYAQEEVAAGTTLVGPHRDDFSINVANGSAILRNLHAFGSRGEQRTAVFNLKLAELDFIKQKTGETPILLLDDIFSELDEVHREKILASLPELQAILTTMDLEVVEERYRKDAQVVKITN